MKKLALALIVALVFSTTAAAVEIAISTQGGWMSQGTADTEAQVIVDNVTGAPIQVFTSGDLDALADWVEAHTGDGVSDLLVMFGIFPDTIYPAGNAQPDGSLAELFLDDGNCIINTGDYIFYVGSAANNDAGGLTNMMDVPAAAMWGDDSLATTFAPTADGRLYTPSLPTSPCNRPWFPAQFEGTDWSVELILAESSDGTQVQPGILRNSVTGGRVGAFFQVSDDTLPRGQVISEWINNWYLKNVDDPRYARGADPADGAIDVPRDVTLSWTAGESAAKHDVYLGTSFDDVNNATTPTSAGQTAASYQPADILDFETTYYWRVDEVNGAPDNTVFKGDVWSFTTEPFAYPIDSVTATTNAVSDAGAGPENTVNGSGLNADDQHSTAAGDMWVTLPGQEGVYIQYEFDTVYKLYEMLVWNYNVQFEQLLGFGIKDVTVEYSIDGENWTVLGDVELAQATARADYTANTTIAFDGVGAKYVRLSVNSGYGMLGQYGLSEVRFLYIPAQAREPEPANNASNISPSTTLAWRAGRDAISHEVYLSTDKQAVADGTALVDTVSDNSYAASGLEFGGSYYWMINEVQDTESWAGPVWRFTTMEFAVIDDMESYDNEDNRIYDTWLDGWVNDTGSTVGYLEEPFAEKTIVHGGSQSMPLQYDNAADPFYSEAEKDLGGMNLTGNGADSLRLFVQGLAPGFAETADGSVLMNAIGTDIWGTGDQFRYVYKSLTGDGSMIARVDNLDGSPSTWAKAGVMIRQGTGTGSQHSFMCMTGGDGNGASWQGRLSEGLDSVNNDATSAVAPPYWVRIDRAGNILTGYLSEDGETWAQVGDARDVAMTGPVLIGLALTSHNANQATSAQFSNVSFTGNVTGNWQVAEIGAAQPAGNDPESVYVALEDSTGKVAVVTHPDTSLTARSGWTEWVIPYTDLSGINLGNVRTMYIGVGNRNNPTAGGAGMIFVDDIGYGRPAQ